MDIAGFHYRRYWLRPFARNYQELTITSCHVLQVPSGSSRISGRFKTERFSVLFLLLLEILLR